MNTPVPVPPTAPREKILAEFKPMLLPTILNLENLIVIGFVLVAVISAAVFHFGIGEIIVFALFFLLLAVPSFKSIFDAGSTNYVLTNHRVVIFTVGVRQRELSIPLDSIDSVRCKSSGLQGLYGAGDVLVKQKGLRSVVRLKGVLECRKRAGQIQQAMKAF
jgi:hypothetical protein